MKEERGGYYKGRLVGRGGLQKENPFKTGDKTKKSRKICWGWGWGKGKKDF